MNLHKIALLFILALASCGRTTENQPNTKSTSKTATNTIELNPSQIKYAGIEMGSMEFKSIATIIRVNGKIDVPPQNMVSVSMPLGGYLKSTKLLPGMHINKGEIIATMEDQQYIQLQQDYLTTLSKVDFYKAEYQRQKELNASQASSDKTLQQIEMEYKTYSITLKSLAEKLKLININPKNLNEQNISKSVHIYAPISGFVSKVNVNIGKYLSPTDILFELVNPDDIHLNLMIFEKDLDKLSIGQKLVAYTNNNPSLKHPCSIILISKDISRERFAEVHCHFEDYDKTLLPGMYMNADIVLNEEQSPCLPDEALVSYDGQQFIFVQIGANAFEMKKVQTGSKHSGFVQILNATELSKYAIVTKGAYSLLMAIKNVTEEE